MHLSDQADEQERQLLMPFVTRLACADTPEVERERAAYIKSRIGCFPTFAEELKILEGVLRIGRQADDVPVDEVRNRMEAVQRAATAPTSVPDTPVFAKLKSWLALT
jgi:hypothetical protein